MQLQRRRLLAPALTYGLARLPQLGTLTTAPLAKYDGTSPFNVARYYQKISSSQRMIAFTLLSSQPIDSTNQSLNCHLIFPCSFPQVTNSPLPVDRVS